MEYVSLAAPGPGSGARACRAALVTTVTLATGGFALICQWPVAAATAPQVALNVGLTSAYAGAAAVFHVKGESRGRVAGLLGGGLLWALASVRVWEWGPLPAIAVLSKSIFWVLVGRACLGFPAGSAIDRCERLYLGTLGFLLTSLTIISFLTSRPTWQCFDADVWWPGPFADRDIHHGIRLTTAGCALGLALWFVWLIGRRLARMPRLDKRVLGASGLTLAAGGVLAGLTAGFQGDHSGRSLQPFALATAVALLGLPASFALGAIRKRFVRAQAAETLARVAHPPTMEAVQAAFAQALRDPSARVLYRQPGLSSYVDTRGALTPEPADDGGRLLVTVVARDGESVALLDLDPALSRHPDLVAATVASGGLALENARLQAGLAHRLATVRESRTRIVETALAERRRLEQDLHDGAQQRLLAVAARIGIARLHAQSRSGPHTAALDHAIEQLQAALGELRGLARGIYPAALSGGGLAVALESALDDFPIRVTLELPPDRYDPATETVAYLTVVDLLTAASLTGATEAVVRSHRGPDELELDIEHAPNTMTSIAADHLLSAVDDRLRALDGRLERAGDPPADPADADGDGTAWTRPRVRLKARIRCA